MQKKGDSSKKGTYRILNASSNCIYGECDGSGLSLVVDEDTGNSFGKYCRCRDTVLQEKRLKFANIPKEFLGLTIKSFDINLYNSHISRQKATLAKKAAVNFVNNYEIFEEKGKGLYFYSNSKGSGKTRLAVSIGNALITTKGVGVKFIRTLDLLSEIKRTWNKDSECTESELINAIIGVQCLILDDIGVEKESLWVNEVFYSILDHRMTKRKITLFTSNSNIEELKYDERIKSRIEKMAMPIYLPDESIRSALAKEENEELIGVLFGGNSIR